jgi:hypothetical protein
VPFWYKLLVPILTCFRAEDRKIKAEAIKPKLDHISERIELTWVKKTFRGTYYKIG